MYNASVTTAIRVYLQPVSLQRYGAQFSLQLWVYGRGLGFYMSLIIF